MPTSRAPAAAHRLTDILRALPQRELDGLIERLAIRIDAAKRIDVPSQIARALVSLPELRDPGRMHPACVELIHRVAEARGSLIVAAVPPGLEPLLTRGLMFARSADGAGVELILPSAYLVQLKPWEGEDPRGMRALLAQAQFETMSAIASHYLGRPATPPIALSLETALETLTSPERLADEIGKLSLTERRVLEGVEAEGGEVDTEELLELEREPLRLRTATGATPSRRGVGFSLERRALLVPVHPNRHVIPTEVSAIIGAAHRSERVAQREEVKLFVATGDHAPRRARFSLDPAPLVMSVAVAARESSRNPEGRTQSGVFADVRPGVGTPKSLVQKLAARFGREPSHVALVIALSRAIGLWELSATNASSPPGNLTLQELTRQLFSTWRRGGAWDEARAEPEVLRLASDARDSSPAGVVRELVVEALKELGEGRWVPWSSLAGWLRNDHRTPGLARLLRRWADRVGAEPVDPVEVARRIVHDSLPALGIVDLGEDEDLPRDPADDDGAPPIALRLTARGRALLADKAPAADAAPSRFIDANALRAGSQARVGAILAIAPFAEVGRAAETLDLIIAPQTLARALSAGLEADVLRARIEALAPLPEALARTLAQASVVVGRASWVPAAGLLWVEDANVREMLRTRRTTQELFVDPSPPGALLVAAGVDLDRLARRCRTIGVEILLEGQVVRARTLPPSAKSTPPPPRLTPSRGVAKADK